MVLAGLNLEPGKFCGLDWVETNYYYHYQKLNGSAETVFVLHVDRIVNGESTSFKSALRTSKTLR